MRQFVAVITTFALVAAVWAKTPVSGTVSGKWTTEESPYLVIGDLLVAKASTLWIEPQVDVVFEGPYVLAVEGKLVAGRKKQKLPIRFDVNLRNREEAVQVRFTADPERNPDGWGGIRFLRAGHENELTNCEVAYARSSENGGGVYLEQSSVEITNSTFRDCVAAGSGGAIAVMKGTVAIVNSQMVNNRASGVGGGIYVANGDATITNATIALNTGGGIHLWRSGAVITNCELRGNSGAAITLLDKSKGVLTNCVVEDHTGAGIVCRESQLVGTNTVIHTTTGSAAAFLDNSEALITNATFKGGVEKDESSQVVATNVDYGRGQRER